MVMNGVFLLCPCYNIIAAFFLENIYVKYFLEEMKNYTANVAHGDVSVFRFNSR